MITIEITGKQQDMLVDAIDIFREAAHSAAVYVDVRKWSDIDREIKDLRKIIFNAEGSGLEKNNTLFADALSIVAPPRVSSCGLPF